MHLWGHVRRFGLVVSTLDSGLRGPGSSPGWVIVLCSWARHFTLTVPLSTQEYKWVPANCTLYMHLWGRGRRFGLVVSSLDSRSRGLSLSPGRVIVLCSWARHFTLTVPLSTQEYKWVPANCQGKLTKCW